MDAQNCIAISELHPNLSHPKVVGIIIGKTDVKSFPDRKNLEIDRFTFGFTVKDSPDFFINVTTWGNDGYVNRLADSFSIGDCVIIENPLVSNKDPEKGDKFCPSTPSLYRLLVTETHSQVCLCADLDVTDRLLPLIHLPAKDSRDFYSLGDIVANGQKLDGTIINILAAVKSIRERKQFTTSDGREGQRLEVKLFDDSVSSFPLIWESLCVPLDDLRLVALTLDPNECLIFTTSTPESFPDICFLHSWDRETIRLLQTLVARETVLFISDVKISFDSFRSCMQATANSKSIITVNPDTREASLLFSYAKEVLESGALDQDEVPEDLPVHSITEVYTVSQLKQKAREHPEAFFGITYSFISRLDLDSSVSKVIKIRCSICKVQVTEDMQNCSNQLCSGRDQAFSATSDFDLLVDFTDHTGTLQSCNLRGPVAEQTLGCTTDQYTALTDDQRTALKWTFLLERCKIYVKILPSPKMKSGIKAVILACSLADPGEVKQHMSILLQRLCSTDFE